MQEQSVVLAQMQMVDNCDVDVSVFGPRRAVKLMMHKYSDARDRETWALEARIQAIIGRCPGSLESAKSGLRAWIGFYRDFLGRKDSAFPPLVEDLLAWSRLFRHPGTFSNYVNYVSLACELLGCATAVFAHPSLKGAKVAIAKRRLFTARTPLFISLCTVEKFMATASAGQTRRVFVVLCLTAYAFLLRVPSEALPIAAHGYEGSNKGATPVLRVHSDKLELVLPRRKNRLHATTLFRKCWCGKSPQTCPVHILGAFFAALPEGSQPFVHLSPAVTLETLRCILEDIGIPDARQYRTHDLRRGHAEDLRIGGATLGEILRAGDWKSPAFLHYLNNEQLEMDRTAEAHWHDSSEEE